MPAPVDIATTRPPDVCWIQLRGQLDGATGPRLAAALDAAADGAGRP